VVSDIGYEILLVTAGFSPAEAGLLDQRIHPKYATQIRPHPHKRTVGMASVSGGHPAKAEEARREQQINAKAQSHREENEKDSVVACRSMGILPMIARCSSVLPSM